jgi:hypothetical protein
MVERQPSKSRPYKIVEQHRYLSSQVVGICPKRLPRVNVFTGKYGAPTMIRTWDLPLRRRTLYPAELPGHRTVILFEFARI